MVVNKKAAYNMLLEGGEAGTGRNVKNGQDVFISGGVTEEG